MTGLEDEGRAMDVVYHDVSKASDKALHSSLITDPVGCETDNWAVM